MEYTVKKLSKIAGVSIRTLHYYDEIGLLTPIRIRGNGYRLYGEKEMLRLQQILFFRELEFSLDAIKNILDAPAFNPAIALEDQKNLLLLKKKKIEKLLFTVDKTMKNLKGGEFMSNDDLYGAFGDDDFKKYQKEAKERWGNTEAYRQSVERTKHWTKDDYKRIKEEGEKWTAKMAMLMDRGVKDPEVQEMIAKHYENLKTFYDPNFEMYRGLGQMYVADPRFTAYYDKHKKGLAVFMCDAMAYFCDVHEKKK